MTAKAEKAEKLKPVQALPAAFVEVVLRKAAQIALARAPSRHKLTGPPLKPTDLLRIDKKTAKTGVKGKAVYYTRGMAVKVDREKDLPSDNVVIQPDDIRLAIQLLGLEHHASSRCPAGVCQPGLSPDRSNHMHVIGQCTK